MDTEYAVKNGCSDHIPGYDVNEKFIRRALKEVDANALRVALYQITGDKVLEVMHVKKHEILGGAVIDYVLTDEDQEVVRRKALEYFQHGPYHDMAPPPSKEEAFRLMDLFSDVPMSCDSRKNWFDYEEGYEQLAFDDFPRDVKWSNDSPPDLADWKVAIVGAGVSGIAAAISLQRLGIPFDIIERQSGVGGTWQLNRYPNVRVDSIGFLYQYRFTKNYKWTEFFPSGAEILAYFEYVSKKFNLTQAIKFNHEVVAAAWDETTSKWDVTLKNCDGEVKLKYNVIISASGLFSTPNLPDIKGINDFKGPIFHTSQWVDAEHEGKRVALIGTGSTGTQVAPALAQTAKHLTVYQRTANWIAPLRDFKAPVTDYANWIYDQMPYYWHWYCYGAFFKSLHTASIQYHDEDWKAKGGSINRLNDSSRKAMTEYIHAKLGDRPDLIAKVMPKSAPFVRRLVVDNGFYDAIKRENVELVTDGIDCITDAGIRTKDGVERQCDVIVLGAGFKVSQYLWPVEYLGTKGMTLQKAWKKDGARSYLGMAMPNYPNLFTLYGPNHQPRGGSLPSYSEMWSRYAVSSIVYMIERGSKSMEVKKEVFDKYNTELDLQTKKIIWESEGASYFVNEHGRQAVNMPWTTSEYHPMIRKVNHDDFNYL